MKRSIQSNRIGGSVAWLSAAAVCLVFGANQVRGQFEARNIGETAAAAGDVDSGLLLPAMSKGQARRVLEDAIRRGVPVFNRGEHAKCVDIYTTACQAMGWGVSKSRSSIWKVAMPAEVAVVVPYSAGSRIRAHSPPGRVQGPGPSPSRPRYSLTSLPTGTGSTVTECAKTLKRTGVGRVDVWVAARALPAK